MKSLKIVLASLLLAIGTLAVSSYTVKSFKSNAFTVICYEYNVSTFDNLDPNNLTTFVQASPFATQTNWSIAEGDPVIDCEGNIQVCRVCFDDSLLSTYTFSQILTSLRNRIVTLDVTPTNGQVYSLSIGGGPSFSVQVYLEPNS